MIFHCEFSSHRGPTLYFLPPLFLLLLLTLNDRCRFLRSWDRLMHEHCYPDLYYPELYVLEGNRNSHTTPSTTSYKNMVGGYKAFFEKRPDLCEPHAYIPMTDGRFTEQMKSGLMSTKHNKRALTSGCNGPTRSRSWSTTVLSPQLDATSLLTQSQPGTTPILTLFEI